MDKRLALALVLTIAVIFITQLLFPPVAPTPQGGKGDSAAVDSPVAAETPAAGEDTGAGAGPARGRAARDTAGAGVPPGDTSPGTGFPPPRRESAAAGAEAAGGDTAGRAGEAAPDAFTREAPAPGDTVVVETPLATYTFSTRGAALTQVALHRYRAFGSEGESTGEPVRLVRPEDRLLGYRVAVGGDTLDLRSRLFEAVGRVAGDTVRVDSAAGPDSVTFRYGLPDTPFSFTVTYRFDPDAYAVSIDGRVEGLQGRGYSVLAGMGRGLRSNEADPSDDYNHLEYAVNSRAEGIERQKLDDVEDGEVRTPENAPFRWVGVKSKYYLVALVRPTESPGFGGLVVRGVPDEHAAETDAAFPVRAGEPGFTLTGYFGPQEYSRLAALGQGLEGVNPYGYEWLQPVIRPLVAVVMAILTWLHDNLNLAYGWVLILFGVMMRVVLFPLYQKSMRAQMAQMEVQPKIKELQSKYEDEPQKLQQEMVKLYKEHNVNPLAGCLPMLLPFPILITLFFVFENTIEFRGVPFWWLPDLSQADPYYIIPLVMGLSMFLLQWIGQRGMERNTQMKVMGYAMPVVFTFIFLRFSAGLNLYYATSNLASLPQQWYLSKERQKVRKEKGLD